MTKEQRNEIKREIKKIAKKYGFKKVSTRFGHATYTPTLDVTLLEGGDIFYCSNWADKKTTKEIVDYLIEKNDISFSTYKEALAKFFANPDNVSRSLYDAVITNYEFKKEGRMPLNQYHPEKYSDNIKNFLKEAMEIIYKNGYYDKSDAMTDYFDTNLFIEFRAGSYDKPYKII